MGAGIILLVEDNPDDVTLTLRALKRSNIANRLEVVSDGEKALEFLHGRGREQGATELPELVLLDLNLPKVSGLDVLKAVRANARTRLLPVVILTSSDEEKDLIESYGLGANSYIRKPVDFGQFSAAIAQLGMYWLVLNEPAPQAVVGDRNERGDPGSER